MGLENKPWDCFPSENKSEIPQPALKEQERTSFAQRVFSCVPYAWRLALAGAVISGGLNLSRVEPASADTSNNPSPITLVEPEQVIKTAGPLPEVKKQVIPLDLELPDAPGVPKGHFFRQTNGLGDNPQINTDLNGYIIYDDQVAPMWTVSQQLGGVDTVGYPVSDRWADDVGRINQGLQKVIPQVKKDLQGNTGLEYMNVFDELAKKGIGLDNPTDLVPDSADWSSDQGKQWGHTQQGPLPETIEGNHFNKVFDQADIPQEYRDSLKQAYLANPKWFDMYGLPMAIKWYKGQEVIVVRGQRVVLQLWEKQMPWTTRPKQITIANGGDVAKKYNLIPAQAKEPKLNPYGVGSAGNGNGSVNGTGTEIFAPELPFPAEVGNLAVNRVVLYNKGTKIGVKLNNAEVFEYRFSNPAKKYFPQAVEYFLYDMEKEEFRIKIYLPIRNNVQSFDRRQGGLLSWPSVNVDYEDNLYISSINKTTGRLEIHVGLPRKKAVPPNDPKLLRRDINIVVSDELSRFIAEAAGGPFNNDPEDIAWLNNPYSRQNIVALNLVE